MMGTRWLTWGALGVASVLLIVAAVCFEAPPAAPASGSRAARLHAAFNIAKKRGLVIQEVGKLTVICDHELPTEPLMRAQGAVAAIAEVLGLESPATNALVIVVSEPWDQVELRIALGARGSLDTREHPQATYNPGADLITIAELPPTGDPDALPALIAHELTHRLMRLSGFERRGGCGAWVEEGLAGLAESLSSQPEQRSQMRATYKALTRADACLDLAKFMGATAEELDRLLPVHLSYAQAGALRSHTVIPGRLQSRALAEYLFANDPEALRRASCSTCGAAEKEEASKIHQEGFLAWMTEETLP